MQRITIRLPQDTETKVCVVGSSHTSIESQPAGEHKHPDDYVLAICERSAFGNEVADQLSFIDAFSLSRICVKGLAPSVAGGGETLWTTTHEVDEIYVLMVGPSRLGSGT